MSKDFPFTLDADKLCIEDLNKALEEMWKAICDISDPQTPDTSGAVLANGTVPMTGCLELPEGCLSNVHAARWDDIRDYFRSKFYSGVVTKTTDSLGCITVPFGRSLAGPVTVTVTQGVAPSLPGAASVGEVRGYKVSATSTQAVICIYNSNGNPISGKPVTLHVQATGEI